ncbi:hypothetical protein EDD86DRAFT_190160 [Gorgonomyces haynaldii]|nr:hypothetical protein EDD86DRAFT_190160 [Gorgonomyces haynaldii]
MLVPLLLQTALAETITRIDYDPNSLFDAVPKATALKFATQDSLSDQFTKKVSLADPFAITMSCPGVPKADCDKAQAALQRAGKRIASQIQISQPININFTFHSFCPTSAFCTTRLGQARASSYFVAKDTDGSYVTYPSALLKQLKPDKTPNYPRFDIVGEFNAQWPWKFSPSDPDPKPLIITGDTGERITLNYFDFEFVAAHEITHGLGFYSSMLYYSDAIGPQVLKGWIAPLPFFSDNGSSDNVNDDAIPGKFQPGTVYDKYIVSKDGSTFADLLKTITSYKPGKTSFSNFVLSFQKTAAPFTAARKAYDIVTAGDGTLFFKAGDQQLPLSATTKFVSGSSISHVRQSSNTTANFLMTPALADNVTLDSFITKYNSEGIYGPGILKIMNTIGYPLVNDPTPLSVTMATDFSGSLKTTVSLMAVALTMLLL